MSLYHGPGGQGQAGAAASLWGRLVGVYGHPEDGLDIDTMRQVSEAMANTPVGDKPGSLVIGPVDVVSQGGIEDVLLKSLEEYNSLSVSVRPYLWAHDIGSVRNTIRSRCLDIWCPGQVATSKYLSQATELLEAVSSGNTIALLDVVGKSENWKQSGDGILRGISEVIRADGSMPISQIEAWQRIRPLLGGVGTGVPLHEVVAVLMSDSGTLGL